MRMAVQLRTKHRILTNPSLFHLFSTSSSDPSDSSDPTEPNPQSHFSSVSDYFSHVRASLKQQSPQQQQQQQQQQSRPIAQNPSFFNTAHSRPSKAASLEEIRQSLSEFRRRSVGPNPTESNSAPGQRSSTAPNPSQHRHISLEEVFNKDAKSMKIKLQEIRESLELIKANANDQNERNLSLSKFTKSLGNNVFGRPGAVPRLLYKELYEKNAENALKTEFVRSYSYEELGEKLKKLRPETKGGGWFTLGELSERLIKLREMKENETASTPMGINFGEIRRCMMKASKSNLFVLTDLGATPYYLPKPPKDVWVEKFFHPDNMFLPKS